MTLTGKLLIAAAAVAAFSGSAMAADLYVPPAAAAAPVAHSSNWDGAYIGANLGYAWGQVNQPTVVTGNGWLVGAQLGYNAHLSDSIVGGIEGNLDWVNEASAVANPGFAVNFEGSLRARLGLDLDSVLPYVELGVAFANVNENNVGAAVRTGWTAGAGVEFWLADQLSANVEYRYSDYGTGAAGTRLTDNSVRVGLNYHF